MNRIRSLGSHLAFMWDRNLIRLALFLGFSRCSSQRRHARAGWGAVGFLG